MGKIVWHKTILVGQVLWETHLPDGRRYTVKKVAHQKKWVAFRNDEPTALQEDTLAEIKQSVENVINATSGLTMKDWRKRR